MKLKYYLRGLGIGIFVSVLAVGLTSGKQKMTDEEVIARAKELGLVESMVLSNINNGPGQADVSEGEPVNVKPTETNEIEPEETKPEETKPEETKPVESESAESEPVETKPIETKPAENKTIDDTVTITIRSGESSVTVSKTLEAAGLVENASDYDRFLCENGYDRKIRVGTYEIPIDADEKEIAEIIAGG